jgi:hypothetical protein
MSLELLKNRIEKMTKHHHIEILRLLMNFDNVNKNSNNNGTFVNLSKQHPDVINTLEKYADYVDEQQQDINDVEKIKVDLEKDFFNDNKTLKYIK